MARLLSIPLIVPFTWPSPLTKHSNPVTPMPLQATPLTKRAQQDYTTPITAQMVRSDQLPAVQQPVSTPMHDAGTGTFYTHKHYNSFHQSKTKNVLNVKLGIKIPLIVFHPIPAS